MMQQSHRWTSLPLAFTTALTLLVACGDPLADGSYRGEPMLTLAGTISMADPEVQASLDGGAPVRLAVFWASNPTTMATPSDTVSGVEQRVEVSQASVLRYSVTIFTPPPNTVLKRPLLGSGTAAFGQVIAYADDNGSRRWEPGLDQLLGGIPNVVLAYTPSGASGAMFPTALDAGYHVLEASDCSSELGVRTLLPTADGLQHQLVLVRHDVPSMYVDLNCDGTGNEWLPSNCPPPDELEVICGSGLDPSTGIALAHQEMCNLCMALGIYDLCVSKLAECGEVWPEICEPYQLCLNGQWYADPFVVCDFEFMSCLGSGVLEEHEAVCRPALSDCLAGAHCTSELRECESTGGPDCDQTYDDCVISATR